MSGQPDGIPTNPAVPPAGTTPGPTVPVSPRSPGPPRQGSPLLLPTQIARVLLSVAGAVLLIIGPFLTWVGTARGIDLTIRTYYQTNFSAASQNVFETAGFPMIVLGVLALAGLAPRGGWLTRLVGALSIAGFILFAVQVYRSALPLSPGAGAWMCLAGGICCLAGGLLGTRPAPEGPVRETYIVRP